MIRRIDRLLLRVEALPAAVSYWRDTLGLSVAYEQPTLAVLATPEGEAQVVLHNASDLPDNALFFLIDDVRAAYAKREELRLHFLSVPQPTSGGYRAAARDPFGNLLLLIDRTGHNDTPDPVSVAGTLFPGIEPATATRAEKLVTLYTAIGRTADDLPYTPHFESIYESYIEDQPQPHPSRAEVWRQLLTLRKSARLPKLGPARSKPPQLTETDRVSLIELLGDQIGRRDRLPYTEKFDQLADAFNSTRTRPIPPHPLWRAIATLAK